MNRIFLSSGDLDEGQGALEYLIILAAVLSIAAIVVLFLTGSFGTQKEQASLARCKQAAAQCKNEKLLTPDAECTQCEEACMDPVTGDPVTSDAVELCKAGEPTKIGAGNGTTGDNGTTENNTAPTADFSYSCDGLTCDFTDQSSDSDGSIVSYEWDWTTDGTYEGSGETADYTYSSGGNYDVTLRVTDDDGATDTYTETVDVGEGNTAPNEPTNPSPSDGATGVSTDPTLSVDVSDPDGDSMDVTFRDASDNSQIGSTQTSISDGGVASVTWSGLNSGTTYNWYAVADDGSATTQSSTWSFTTATGTTEYNLTVSSTSGGSVEGPGEGEFTYEEGNEVTLNASPNTGYYFANWTGDTGTIDDTDSPDTAITMNGDKEVTANFGECNGGQICTWHDLNDVRNNLDGDYTLMRDLDEDTAGYSDYNTGNGWNPIGTFTGTFDGQGRTISDLYIDRGSTNNVGLFGYTDFGAKITNVGLENINITGDSLVGGLVGYNGGGVSDCYSTGSVSGSVDVGGLIGWNDQGSVSSCYSTGSVTGGGWSVGGLIGRNWGGVSGSYWNNETTNQESGVGDGSSSGVFGRNTEDMTDYLDYYPNAYEGWDFTDTWKATSWNSDHEGNTGYPALQWQQ